MARSLGYWFMALALAAAGGCQRSDSPRQTGAPGRAPDGGGAEAVSPDIGALAAAGSPERARFEGEFIATGAEPGWRLDLLQDYVSFTRPGLPAVGGLPNPPEIGARGMRVKAGALLVTVVEEPCTYGDSPAFAYSAEVRYQGVAYKGCAQRASGETQSGSWAGMVEDLAPAIDLCLGRARSKPARVTIAYEAQEGLSNVRLLDADGGRFECVVERGAITYFETIGDRDILGGERDPLFTRAPDLPPEGPCLASEPAPQELGWLTRRIC